MTACRLALTLWGALLLAGLLALALHPALYPSDATDTGGML